ncbi:MULTISPECIES: FAD-dependent oxidoreductase [unclassified Mycobacterium]|uniref:FAD-dependent oxidoreductase n=1 Tax=unclassified Mycobacterium TaxID=2642494 RepID=UPI0029C828BC|nr:MULTISPECIES: FAD-dependent oxidoreductase [unclassified Mycobacterium]
MQAAKQSTGEHAVVMGAGMAGLLVARVLSEFYRTVIVVERDVLPGAPVARKGVPQGRHIHSCLSRGTQVMGEMFPGLLDELAEAGAVVIDDGDLSRIHARVGRHEFNPSGRFADPAALVLHLASRPFLEFHVRRRVGLLDNVAILDNHTLVEPVAHAGSITGVQAVDSDGVGMELEADLVVDATGRASRIPALLESLGYPAPSEQRSAANWAYSSQLMSIPDGEFVERMAMVNPGTGKPRALLVANEHGQWMLAVGRASHTGAPPTDFAGMLAAAEEVMPPSIAAGLRSAKPLADVTVFRNSVSVWRRYDQLNRFPAGLLVVGDAWCSLNPIYGQGMTMAALDALALRDCLRAGRADLARRFFALAAERIGPVWSVNRVNDGGASSARSSRSVTRRLGRWTLDAVLQAASTNVAVAEQLLRVNNLVDPPARLQNRALLPRILFAKLRHPIK